MMAGGAAEPQESWEELLLAGPSTLSADCPAPYPSRAFFDLVDQSPFGQCRVSEHSHLAANELRSLRVLSLHFSDPMTLMRSVATAGRLGYSSVHWHINCENQDLMARNLLLLCVARTADGPEDWRFFWTIFFNKYILPEHKLRLKALLNGLAEGGANGGRSDQLLNGVEAPGPVLTRLRAIWKAWLGGLKCRSSSLPAWGSQSQSVDSYVDGVDSIRAMVDWLGSRKLWPRDQIAEAAYRYLVTPKLLDPQLAYDAGAFNVWANPLVGTFWPAVERDSLLPFDLFAPFVDVGASATTGSGRIKGTSSSSSRRSLVELCFDRAADLVSEFAAACRSEAPSLRISVGVGNDLLAASRQRAASQLYHLVDAGSLADHCPLCDILTACQPLLLSTQSLLLTLNSRWLYHYPSAPAYLEAAQGRLPELLYGLRLYKPSESELLPAARTSDRPHLLLRWAPSPTDSYRQAQIATLLDPLLPHCIGPPAYGRLAYGCYPVAEARLSPRTLHRLLSNHGMDYFELDLVSRMPMLAKVLLSTRQGEQFDPHYLLFSTLCRPQQLVCLTIDLRRPGTLLNVDQLCSPGAQLIAVVFESGLDVAAFAGAYDDLAADAGDETDAAVARDACAQLQRRLASRVKAFDKPFYILPLLTIGVSGGGGVARVFLPAETADKLGRCCCLLLDPSRCLTGRTRNNRSLLWSSLVAGRLSEFRPAGGLEWPGAKQKQIFMELPLQFAARPFDSPALFGARLGLSRPPPLAAAQLASWLGKSAYPALFDSLAAKATIGGISASKLATCEIEAERHWAAFVAQLLALRWADIGCVFLRDIGFTCDSIGIRLRLLEAGCRGSRPLLLARQLGSGGSAESSNSALPSVTLLCSTHLISELVEALNQCQVCPGVSCLLLPLRLPVWQHRARQLRRLEAMQERIGRLDCAPCQV